MPHASEREQLIERAFEAGVRQGCREDGLLELLSRYFHHVALEDLRERDAVDLAGAATSHRQLAGQRPIGTANARVFSPTVDEHGWSTGHTVIEIVIDDMPFLVDSVNGELSRQDRSIHLVVHPQIIVRRDAAGTLLEVLDVSAYDIAGGHEAPLPRDAVIESWIHVEIDRMTDPDDLADVATGLRRVLEDVRVAVEDWAKMHQTVLDVAAGLESAPPAGVAEQEVGEAVELLSWLAQNRFTFLGYREYRLDTRDGADILVGLTGTGLGILRYDQPAQHSESFGRLTPQARAKAREKKILVLTKANTRATVHRPAYLDYVGVKVFDAAGEVVGERRFLGLFSSSAYTDSVMRIPYLSRKVEAVLDRAGFLESTHSGKDLLQILETYPRDELFVMDVAELYPVALAVVHLQERRRTRLFLRRDVYGRYVSALVYLPRDRYTTAVRLKMEAILKDAFNAPTLDFSTRISESVLARLHFVLRVEPGQTLAEVDQGEVEARLVEATRTWEEDLGDALRADVGEEDAATLLRMWLRGFPEAYKEDFAARVAVADIKRLEDLHVQGEDVPDADLLGMNLYEPVGADLTERRFKLYRYAPLSLTAVLPYLSNLGVEVVDERPYEIQRSDGRRAWIYDFGLRYAGPAEVNEQSRALFSDAFSAAWSGQAESDGFDRLVLLAGLTWRQVVLLRACAKYLRQTGTTFSQAYIERCLATNLDISRLLVELFEIRFDPDAFAGDDEPAQRAGQARGEAADRVVATIRAQLDDVASLDHDRILRSFLTLVLATLRTNYYVDGQAHAHAGPGGHVPKPYVSFKLDPRAIPDLPAPRPAYEVFVYSPRVEGVHLRFGKVARGGLRWSDRREDFRTEILGLVKAQMVKNAVIVPTGAKGGFYAKQLPDLGNREEWLAEGIRAYTTFICGLLDVTDNLVGGTVVPPPHVIRHDGDDTYLVVAADKGTATFSDLANGISADYGFWLGDAFASGGSVGYDHKAMAITAKGAWESVKRHFRELGRDVQTTDFTVVGIGDMSGDVFGNGMLLSEHIRLVAAFDHRHLFLDPDPDAAISFAERARLFALPGSSWADYAPELVSTGGGVYSRAAKTIPVSPQVAARLGLPSGVDHLTPNDMLRAILCAPVDLLWNGGIGTYVKASTQTQAEVGDKANDGIRVDGRHLRVRVVGEGGNLGLSQPGRVEAALNGVRVNTDAIDNSAGVDCSDHEVNIKILLDRIVAAGDLTSKQRNRLLAEMTDEVGRLVLRDNYEQNVLLGNARKQSHALLSVHQRFIRSLEGRGLDRALEFLPDDPGLAERHDEGLGLTSPEFSVLVAYAKIALAEDVVASDLPDDPWLEQVLRDYFPSALVERYGERLAEHPLRREIITNCLVNDLVNRGGITFAFRCMEETAASTDQIARAYMIAQSVFGLIDFVADVEALDNVVPTEAQTALYLEFRRLLDRSVRWFLQTRPGRLNIRAEIERFRPTVEALRPVVADLIVGAEHKALVEMADDFVRLGVPQEMAVRGAALLNVFQLLDITEIAAATKRDPLEVARVYLTLSERYAVDAMLTRISSLERQDRWQSLARAALRYDLYSALEALTVAVLTAPLELAEPGAEAGAEPGAEAQERESAGPAADGTAVEGTAAVDGAAPAEGPAVQGARAPAGVSSLARIEAWERANSAAVARATQTLEEVRRLEKGDLASLSVALRTLRSVVRPTA